MLNGVYQNAAAMNGLEAWNNAIAQNLAQSSNPGYKKALASFEGVAEGKVGFASSTGAARLRDVVAVSPEHSVSFEQGAIAPTGNELEFAIEGPGFFRLQTPEGGEVYTRDGQFKLSEQGELVSKQGYRVLSEGGAPIALIPGNGRVKATSDGALLQGGQRIGALGVVDIEDKSALVRTHGGFAIPETDPTRPEAVRDPVVRQGALEQSNVSMVGEMVNLVNVSRAHQINQRVVQQMDDLLGQAIRSMGGHT